MKNENSIKSNRYSLKTDLLICWPYSGPCPIRCRRQPSGAKGGRCWQQLPTTHAALGRDREQDPSLSLLRNCAQGQPADISEGTQKVSGLSVSWHDVFHVLSDQSAVRCFRWGYETALLWVLKAWSPIMVYYNRLVFCFFLREFEAIHVSWWLSQIEFLCCFSSKRLLSAMLWVVSVC